MIFLQDPFRIQIARLHFLFPRKSNFYKFIYRKQIIQNKIFE